MMIVIVMVKTAASPCTRYVLRVFYIYMCIYIHTQTLIYMRYTLLLFQLYSWEIEAQIGYVTCIS